MSQLGRISGQLLKDNLTRNGHDLTFDATTANPEGLLHLDVINRRIGIKTLTPATELEVIGTTQTTNVIVTGQSDLGNITVLGDTITSNTGTLNLINSTGNQVNYQTKLVVDNIDIDGNIISTNATDVDLILDPTGNLEVFANTNVYGNIYATGDIQADGNIIVGNANTDNITFNAEVASNIIPNVNNEFTLGNIDFQWKDLWVKNVYADEINSNELTVDGIDLILRQGNIYYVSTNGSDASSGTHQNDPFLTIKHALSVATIGETVYIYPGTYTEIFPLAVPAGVNIKGSGIRSVKIVPTTATRYNDAFLLNGETTVEDITIADFFSGGNYFAVNTAGIGETVMNVGTAPFAHTWVSGGTINISGTAYSIIAAVYSHTTGVLTVNHTGPDATNASPVFLSGLIFSCNGGNRVFPDNGYAFRFATDFAVSSRSPYVRNITVLTKGSVISLSDPLGYDAGDAGKGAYIDGAYATALSKEASMLFHSATFICPGVDIIVATNGARVEWLNSFTYYANRSMHLYSSADGLAGDGKTRVKITDTTGTWAVGNTLSYYDTDGSTVLASGVIESIDGDFYNIDSRVLGFEQIQDRAGKTITVHGNAKLSTAVKKFGTASLALDGTGDYLSVATQPDFAFPSTISRLAKTITANGNAAVSATQSKFGGSSIAFDGTGDYLSIATDTDYGFGTGDFTIEGWFYKTAVTTQYLFDTRTTLNENSVAVQSNGSGSLRLFVNGAFVLTSSNAHTNNAWNHLAICRASGVTRFFINGVVSTATYTDATNYGTTKPLVVGSQYNGTTAFAGYIDDFRISNTARYTATFTPTTTAFVNDFNTKLLIHGDSTIVDDAGGGTATDFTLEAWIYPTITTYHSIFDFRSVSTEEAIYLGINLSNQIYLYVNGAVPITTAAISLNVWTHVAVVRSSGTTKIYVNGTQSGASWADITNYGTTKPLRIGAWYNALYGFTGYIDDVRITKGIARYTATFPVPTAQLTGDLSTVLLITLNGANNSTAIADNGITLQDLRTSAGGTASIIDFADYSDFGVEVRSIGSAAVYGNYGIYGDGVGVIAYLIGQNLAYIGNGKSTTNDPITVIQANEVVELNDARIFYNSVDHKGDFRIGDLFYVNQATGEVSFTNSNVTIGTSLTFDNNLGDVTFLDATKIETGDFRISGNTIQTLTQDFNVSAASDLINLQSNVNISGNLDVTGNVTIGGNITIGDQSTDTVSFVAGVNSDIIPTNPLGTPTYNLGTASLQWLHLYASQISIADVQIDTNVVRTITTDTDLTLQANGTGRIYVPTNDVEFDQNLTVNGTTTVKDTNIGTVGTPAILTHIGALNQTGDLTQTGNINLTGTFTTSDYAQFADILITGNQLKTTLGTNDLTLGANSTGRVYIPSNDVQIDQNLTVTGYIDVNTLNVNTTISSNSFTTGDIIIEDNTIYTTLNNNNLILEAAGSGKIYVPTNDVQLDQNLTVNGTTNLAITNIGVVGTTATVTHIGDVDQTGNLTQTGSTEITGTLTVGSTAQFQDIKIDTNTITTTVGTNNLVLSAAGTGRIYVPTNDVTIENTLTVVGITTTNTVNNTGTVTSGTFNTSNVSITSNNITSRTGNSNLVLEAAGSGKIYVPTNDVQLDQNLTVNGTTYLKDTTVVGTVTHTGAVDQTGNLTQTGSTEITGTLTVGSTAQFQDIKIDTNIITTTVGSNNLILKANGTGIVIIPEDNVSITQTLTVTGTTSTTTINNTGTITSDTFNTSNVSINANNITSRTGNSNLVLEAAGSGKIYVPTNNVQLDQNLTVNGTTYLKTTNIGVVGTPATVTHVGAVTQTGNLTQTGSTEITGTLTVGSTAQFQDIKIDTNVITTTVGSNNLILKANGTGIVIIPEDDVSITQTLTVSGTTSTTTINNTGTITSNTFNTTNVSINGNTITSRTGDSNLVLEASGLGKIYVPDNNVSLGKTLTVIGNTTLDDTSITGTLTITGATTQTGDVVQTGNYTLHGNLTVDNIAQFKDVNITNNVITTTIGNNNLQLSAAGTGRIYVPTNDVTIENNLTVVGTSTTATINNTGTVTSSTFSTGNISISGNTIQTTTSNSNLQLQAAGTGYITLEQFDIQENEIRINTGSDMVLTPNGFGIVSVNSTQSIKIPVGNTAARPTGAAGMIRFNTELTRYEGHNGTAWVRLDGVEDADGNTKITAELTPGANDNTIRFYTNGTQVADLTSTRLNVSNLDVGSINVNNNVISTTTTNTNLVLAPNGSGSVRIGNFAFNSNVITNTVNNSITYINQTGNGYVKISNTGGFVIPAGLTEQRPPLFAVGMLRYNTDPGNFRVEVWDGANWINAGQAAGGGVTVSEANDIGIVSAIIFG